VATIWGVYYFQKAAGMGDVIKSVFDKSTYAHYSIGDWIAFIVIGPILIIVILVVSTSLFGLVSATAATPFAVFPELAAWVLKQILKVVTLEGLLLTIGTCIFLISKCLSFWKPD